MLIDQSKIVLKIVMSNNFFILFVFAFGLSKAKLSLTFPRLASVANFGTDYFMFKIIILVKRKREFTTKFEIAPNVCWQ